MVVGGGPAGLECALALSKRGYHVVLADKESELGGRVLLESRLPGLSEWKRVVDHRVYMLSQKANVETYLQSELDTADILEYGFEHIVIATGSAWRTDCVGLSLQSPVAVAPGASIVSVDEILRGARVQGHVAIYDDNYYYMANVIAEKLRLDGCKVTYVTSAVEVAPFTRATLEQFRIQQRLLELEVEIICGHTVAAVEESGVTLSCIYTSRPTSVYCDVLLPVTSRTPTQSIFTELDHHPDLSEHGIKSAQAIGDCHAPGTIATAVYSGHQYARQLDNATDLRYDLPRENYQSQVLGQSRP